MSHTHQDTHTHIYLKRYLVQFFLFYCFTGCSLDLNTEHQDG